MIRGVRNGALGALETMHGPGGKAVCERWQREISEATDREKASVSPTSSLADCIKSMLDCL